MGRRPSRGIRIATATAMANNHKTVKTHSRLTDIRFLTKT